MILLISTCAEKLSEEEFVSPIANIVGKDYFVMHYSKITATNIKKYEKIIICGTALADYEYFDHLDKFGFLKETIASVLGICSGMQIICSLFSAKIVKSKEIGMIDIEVSRKNSLFSKDFQAYALHGNSVAGLDSFEILARSEKCIEAVKLKGKEIFGILFHPEVRNAHIIENFLLGSTKPI
ncbi:MAG: hypothetical protein ABIJ34_08685 [archaeon]